MQRPPNAGGLSPRAARGDEIIMNTGPSTCTVIAVTTTPRVGFGRPGDFPRVGRSEPGVNTGRRNVDMMPDGQHVIGVMVQGALQAGGEQAITVVLNWFDEVRQRVPVR